MPPGPSLHHQVWLPSFQGVTRRHWSSAAPYLARSWCPWVWVLLKEHKLANAAQELSFHPSRTPGKCTWTEPSLCTEPWRPWWRSVLISTCPVLTCSWGPLFEGRKLWNRTGIKCSPCKGESCLESRARGEVENNWERSPSGVAQIRLPEQRFWHKETKVNLTAKHSVPTHYFGDILFLLWQLQYFFGFLSPSKGTLTLWLFYYHVVLTVNLSAMS